MCGKFYDYLYFTLDQSFKKARAGKKTNKFPCNAWFDSQCTDIKYRLNNFAKQWDISIPENWQEYQDIARNYKQVIQSKKRKFKNKQLSDFQDMLSSDPNEYWKFWKNLKRNVSPSSDCIDMDTFVDYFKSQNTPPMPDYYEQEFMHEVEDFVEKYKLNIIDSHNDVIDEIINKVIVEDEVHTQLRKLKPGKACGLDGIGIEFLKCAGKEIVPHITALFNYVLCHGEYPSNGVTV